MSEIDWAALQKEAQDTLIPDGDYVAMVTKADATTASTGKPMIKLQLTIVEGPKRDRKLFTQIVLSAESPFALQRWFSNLACFGLDAGYFGTNPTIERIAEDLVNRGAVVTVGHREWQGSDRNEVASYKPYAPNGPLPPGMIVGPVTASGPRPPATPTQAAGPAAPASTASQAPSTAPPSRPF